MGRTRPFKFRFPDGKDPAVKKRAAVFTLLLLTALLALAYNQDYRDPDSCGICHTMSPYYSTWAASSHQRTPCVICHQEPGFKNYFRFQAGLAVMAYRYVTGDYFLPVTKKEKMEAGVCHGCHSTKAYVSASGDLIVPHAAHTGVKVDCQQCHRGVVHANISSRRLALSLDKDIWEPSFAKSQMSYQFRNLSMQQCMECHQIRRAPLYCAACHREISYPESHRDRAFLTGHGFQAYRDIISCDRCHSWSSRESDGEGAGEGEHPVRKYARQNSFCTRCHLKRPEGHDAAYKANHAYLARERGRYGCLVCHDYQQSLSGLKGKSSSKVFCNSCHQGLHRRGWQDQHPLPVRGKKYDRDCMGCHGSLYCGKCHLIQ